MKFFTFKQFTTRLDEALKEQRDRGVRSEAIILNKAERHEFYQCGSDKWVPEGRLGGERPVHIHPEDPSYRGRYWGLPMMAEEHLPPTLDTSKPVYNRKTGRWLEVESV